MPANRVIGGAVCAALLVAVPAPALAAGAPTNTSVGITSHTWARVQQLGKALKVIRTCEASGNYRTNSGNGYYGAYQFSAATWHSLGLKGLPHQAPSILQDAAAARLHDARHSWADWGACGRKAAVVHA